MARPKKTETDDSESKVLLGMPVAEARDKLGHAWGLERPLTRAEIARALGLSPKWGGSFISKLELPPERNPPGLAGPTAVALRMMLDGARPPTMDDVIKPGYPRGPVR